MRKHCSATLHVYPGIPVGVKPGGWHHACECGRRCFCGDTIPHR